MKTDEHFIMDTASKNTIKENLLAEKKRLEDQLAQFAAKDGADAYEVNFPQIGDKDDENAAEVDTYSTNLALERTLRTALRDVQSALKRIEDNTYGFCKYCGQEIELKRLQARPVSSACVECKKRLTQEV
jgi:DnaK suppressor protein